MLKYPKDWKNPQYEVELSGGELTVKANVSAMDIVEIIESMPSEDIMEIIYRIADDTKRLQLLKVWLIDG